MSDDRDPIMPLRGLTFMQECMIADALIAYALSPTSTDQRIRNVIEILEALEYPETAATLERLQNDSHSVRA